MIHSTNSLAPKIYVACLAAYNDGHLHGTWIDAVQPIDNIYKEIVAMLANSPIPNAEEWAIHDYEDFGEVVLHEYEGIETVVEIANYLAEHGEVGAAVLEHTGRDLKEATMYMEEEYCGEFESKEDFATDMMEQLYDIPENIAYYIDYKLFARDLFISDYLSFEIGDAMHVFRQV